MDNPAVTNEEEFWTAASQVCFVSDEAEMAEEDNPPGDLEGAVEHGEATPHATPTDIAPHLAHMRAVVAAAGPDSVVTVSDLFGSSDPTDPRVVTATRSFVINNRKLGLRLPDVNAHHAEAKRAAKAARAVVLVPVGDERSGAVYSWVSGEFIRLGCKVDCAGNIVHKRYNTHKLGLALSILNADLGRDHSFPTEAVRGALTLLIDDHRRVRLAELRDHLSGAHLVEPVSGVLGRLRDLLALGLASGNAFKPDEAALLIAKFVWQAKRKMADLPVSGHVMLVLTGPQGGGKSTLVDQLVSPVREVTINTDMRAITDDRNIQLFDNFVGVIDELDKADRTSVESLKRVISDATMARRPMRENSMVRVKQNLTFIGTSNRDVSEAIIDETGNRRFAQLTIIAPGDQNAAAFWAAVRDFDWLALWRAVDEGKDDPAAQIALKVAETQRAERSRSYIELWLEQLIEDGNSYVAPDHFSKSQNLFANYREWEETYAPKAFSNYAMFCKSFSRMSKHGLIPFEARHSRDGNGYVCTRE